MELQPESITIRQVQSDELPSLLEFARSTFEHTYRHLNDPDEFEKYLSDNFSIEKFRTEIENPASEFYFVISGSGIAGYFKINTGQAQTESYNLEALEIERIYVHPNYKRMGLGHRMIEKVKSIAGEKGIQEVWLGVWEKNPMAIKFYEAQGFEAFDTHIFTIGDDDQTDIMMRLRLVG